ncbi:MAG TPA: uracil-DNA glycosylase [Nitriliruptorales bacterium]
MDLEFTSLARVEAAVVSCRTCPRLVAWREHVAATKRASFQEWEYWGRPVPGFGDPKARIVTVGLAPAAHGANRTGRMFTGDRSGDWLFASLHRVGIANQPTATHVGDGLELRGLWMSAPVKCAPPQNKPTIEERDACQRFLVHELALLDARVIVALGAFGWDAVLRVLRWDGRKPRFGHAAEATAASGHVLLGCYHPSQHNTFTGRLTEDMTDAVFQRAKQLAGLS